MVWHSNINTLASEGKVTATELLRAGDLYIQTLKHKGGIQYREIMDVNNLSYNTYKACGEIILQPRVVEHIVDGVMKKVQYWGFIIK